MKKLNVLLTCLSIAFFTFSCNDALEDYQPKPTEDPTQANQSIPHYDEKNSALVTWDQLPEELKNAIPITQDSSTSLSNARVQGSSYAFKYGPFGGNGGSPFSIFPPDGSRIYAMAIRSSGVIHGIVIWYQKGATIYRVGVGGTGGRYYQQFFTPTERIVRVSGRSGWVVDRLSVRTNFKTFTYGGTGGNAFVAEVPPGYQILGFWGRAGIYLDQIGFYAYRN
jgi:hypothetical protein